MSPLPDVGLVGVAGEDSEHHLLHVMRGDGMDVERAALFLLHLYLDGSHKPPSKSHNIRMQTKKLLVETFSSICAECVECKAGFA